MVQLMLPVSFILHPTLSRTDRTVSSRYIDIVFTGKEAVLPSAAMTKNYITQFAKLKSMGDELVSSLATHLKLSSGHAEAPSSLAKPSGHAKPTSGHAKSSASHVKTASGPAKTHVVDTTQLDSCS